MLSSLRRVCVCRSGLHGVSHCSRGKDVFIEPEWWAGDLRSPNAEARRQNAMFVWTWKTFNETYSDLFRSEFAAGECLSSSCSRHALKPWVLSRESPCKASYHRTGIFCQQCKKPFTEMVGLFVSFKLP